MAPRVARIASFLVALLAVGPVLRLSAKSGAPVLDKRTVTFAVADAPMPAQTAFRIFATAVAESGLEPTQVDTVTQAVWAALHDLVMLSITKRLRPGRALHRTRLDQLTAAIVAITQPT